MFSCSGSLGKFHIRWLLLILVLTCSCREKEQERELRFQDASSIVILEQPGTVAEKIVSWLKNVLTEKERKFQIIRKNELAEFRSAGDRLTLPLLIIPDATRIEFDILQELVNHINSGARVLLIGEKPFEEIGVWEENKWINTLEAAERFENFPLKISPLAGDWNTFKSGRLLPSSVKELAFANGALFESSASVGVSIKGKAEGDGAVEIIDQLGNRWRRDFKAAEFSAGQGFFWWDEFVLVDAKGREKEKTMFFEKAALVALSESPLHFLSASLISWRDSQARSLRPEIPGVSPAVQRIILDEVQELTLWTGSRVPLRGLEQRVLSAPTLQGRSSTLAANWRQIPLIYAKGKMSQRNSPIASVLLRSDCNKNEDCIRQRIGWFSLNADELDVLRLESLWTEALQEAIHSLEQNFAIICVGTNGPTILANEIPVIRARYDFCQIEDEVFPRLDVEIYPVGKTAPVYRSISQRMIEPGVVEAQIPSSISPGEYEVSVKYGTSLSTQISTRLQVEPRLFPRVERIEFSSGYILRDGSVWVNKGLQYSPTFMTRLPHTSGLRPDWLSPAYYDPVQVDEDLCLLLKMEVDSLRIDITDLNSAAQLRDFLFRALNKKIFIRVNLSSLLSSERSTGEIQDFIKNSRLDEHRIAWFWDILENPVFGEENARQNAGRIWQAWLQTYYGGSEKLAAMLESDSASWVKNRNTPPDDFLTANGPWNPGVQVYRAFLKDYAYTTAGELSRTALSLRKFGSHGVRTGWQGSLNSENLKTSPWWSGMAGMCFQTVSIGLDNILDPDSNSLPILLLAAVAEEHMKADSLLFFDGLAGDTLDILPWMSATTRKTLFRSLYNLRKKIPRGAWWLGNAFEGYDAAGRWKPGLFNTIGMPTESWNLWREKFPVSPRASGRRATELAEEQEPLIIKLDLESDARGPLGSILRFTEQSTVEIPAGGIRVEIGPPAPDNIFDRVAGLPQGRLRYLSAHLTGIKVIDSRGMHEPSFSRAGATISMAKGQVTVTLSFENNGISEWTMRSREEALVVKNMQTGEIVAKIDRTVRKGEKIEVNIRSTAEKLVASGRSTYGLYWDDKLIYVTPEIRWTPTRDWR